MTRRSRANEASYLIRSDRSRAGFNRDLDIVDEKDLHPERSLTSIFKTHHRDPAAFKRNVSTHKIGSRLELASPAERRLYRGPQTIQADEEREGAAR